MNLQGKALRVTIYIGESDHFQGKALYMALLELLRREGASGATVTRGLAGFGPRSRIHTATILTLSEDLPLKIEWVDRPEIVERLMPQVKQMVNDGLITLEEIDVIQYAPGRQADPLAQRVVDIMQTEVTTVTPTTPVKDIVQLLLRRGYGSVPVVNADRGLVGIITDGDLLLRAGVSARLDLQDILNEMQVMQQIGDLEEREQTAENIMTQPVIAIQELSTLRQAVNRMVKNNLKRLPVINIQGQLTGWISRVDVLRTLDYHHLPKDTTPQHQAGSTVAELMYSDVPSVALDTTLEKILQVLESNTYRRVVVVDNSGQVLGIITDGDLLRRSQDKDNPGLVARLRSLITGKRPQSPLLASQETAADLMTTPVITISIDTSITEALRLMLHHKIKRLPVLDDNGKLVGLLGRGNLLRGSIQ
jgi:CBS domain-containing protein/PII-like signaling protein